MSLDEMLDYLYNRLDDEKKFEVEKKFITSESDFEIISCISRMKRLGKSEDEIKQYFLNTKEKARTLLIKSGVLS